MTTTARGNTTITEQKPVSGVRIVADTAQRWLAVLAVVLCALQIGFAALGFWGGTLDPGNEAASRAAFQPHYWDGTVLSYLAVLLLICGVIARPNKISWILPLAAAIDLFVVQGMLVGLGFGVSIWFGFVHAISGTAITAAFVWLMVNRWRYPLATS